MVAKSNRQREPATDQSGNPCDRVRNILGYPLLVEKVREVLPNYLAKGIDFRPFDFHSFDFWHTPTYFFGMTAIGIAGKHPTAFASAYP